MGACCGKQAAISKGKELVDGGGGGEGTVSSVLHSGPALTAEQIEQRKQITTIYKHYKPKQMEELTGIFEKYNGRENEVLEDLWRQYPATVRASAKVGYDFYGGGPKEETELRESSVASSAMGAFRASQATDCWAYLDGDHELGPFTVAEMQERLKDGRFKGDGMKIKMSHWQDWHSLSEIFASGEEFSIVVPLEPGVTAAPPSLVSMKGTAPRPMMHRKGSLIPIVQGALLPTTSQPSPAPALAPAPAQAPASAAAPALTPDPDPATPTSAPSSPTPTPNPIALPV